jgi:hypothetical protein
MFISAAAEFLFRENINVIKARQHTSLAPRGLKKHEHQDVTVTSGVVWLLFMPCFYVLAPKRCSLSTV